MAIPQTVKIVEVGPRDGLQNEKEQVPTAIKIELVNRLSAAGFPNVETTSFVSPKWVPQMADGADVMAGIERRAGTIYSVLTPNLRGLEGALAAAADEIVIFGAASEAFSQKNINCSIAESIDRFAEVARAAKEHRKRLRAAVTQVFPRERLSGHFHDTYGQALANIYAALQDGIAIFHASVAGLGGCPYAKGATGNVATEDVLYLMNGLGIETGVDLAQVVEIGDFISKSIGRQNVSRAGKALLAKARSESTNCA
jgi:hydroxymethylglutaryl-CoA lyase